MPTYEYRCTACGEHLEIVQSFKDEPLTTCPACDGPLRKVFGTIGVVFKGGGFYKTDSRPAAKADKAEATGTGGSPSSSGSPAKSDSSSSSSKPAPSSSGSSSSSKTEASA